MSKKYEIRVYDQKKKQLTHFKIYKILLTINAIYIYYKK